MVVTFKENVSDIRNSKVIDIIKKLELRNFKVYVKDLYADMKEVEREYKIHIDQNEQDEKVDVLIVAVAHDKYRNMTNNEILGMLNKNKIVFDIKNILNKEELVKLGVDYWRL